MITDSPADQTVKCTLTPKGRAFMAAMGSGICRKTVDDVNVFDYEAFEKFWSLYLERLAIKQEEDIAYTSEVLNKQRWQRKEAILCWSILLVNVASLIAVIACAVVTVLR